MATTRILLNQLGGIGRRATKLRNAAHLKRIKKSNELYKIQKSKDDGDISSGERKMHFDLERPTPVGRPVECDLDVKRYSAFQYDQRLYRLEDPVLVSPEKANTRPDVAIIKGISVTPDGSVSVTVQWLYRPEKLNNTDESWSSVDNRELLLTNHKEDIPAEAIMHNCVIHFLPDWKKLPDRKKDPGFIVLHFYDHLKKTMCKITCDDTGSLQFGICLRLQETKSRIGLEDTPKMFVYFNSGLM